MGGRGTFASGNSVPLTYQNVEKIHDVWVVKGINGKHSLPVESHKSNAYIKLEHDGTFKEMRIYAKNHKPLYEIAYHSEPQLNNGKKDKIFHVHYYDKYGNRSNAKPIPKKLFEKYKKYYKGVM